MAPNMDPEHAQQLNNHITGKYYYMHKVTELPYTTPWHETHMFGHDASGTATSMYEYYMHAGQCQTHAYYILHMMHDRAMYVRSIEPLQGTDTYEQRFAAKSRQCDRAG